MIVNMFTGCHKLCSPLYGPAFSYLFNIFLVINMSRKNNTKQTRSVNHDLLIEFTTALKDLDKHRYDFDPADYRRKRAKMLEKAEQYFTNFILN